MKIELKIIGAGEFTSFGMDDHAGTQYFLRILRSDGMVMDLPVDEDQLGALVHFGAGSEIPAQPALVRQEREVPPEDEDGEMPALQVRGLSPGLQTFVPGEDEPL